MEQPNIQRSIALEDRPRMWIVAKGVLHDAGRLARRHPIGATSSVAVIAFVVLALGAPLFSRYDPLLTDPANGLAGPSADHWLGTDRFGRDVYSRLIYGTRVSVLMAVAPIFLALLLGTAVGLVSGFLGGWVDDALQRLVDAVMAFPALVLALVFVALLGTELRNVVIAIAIIMSPGIARLARASVLATRQLPYVEAARVLGGNGWRVALRHILPNIVSPLIILGTSLSGAAVLAEASLAYLGFGTQPPDPSWGNMLGHDTRQYFTVAPWLAIFPGVALGVLVLALNLFGDALRDALDPRSDRRSAL